MSDEKCTENWHVFAGGLPSMGAICQCGLKRATAKLGVLEDEAAQDASRDSGESRALGMTTTELGLEVPVKAGEEYRVHTAERWRDPQRGDPLSYEFCLYLIRTLLIVNRSELERQVSEHRARRGLPGISRNSIIALINDPVEFKPGEIEDIIKRSAALLTMESTGKARELIDKSSSTKDIGAVAMMMTSAHNIKQLSSGGPTEIREHRHRFSIEDFEDARAKRMRDVTPVVPVVDVPARDVPMERVAVVTVEEKEILNGEVRQAGPDDSK